MQFDKDLNSPHAELFLEVREFLTNEIKNYVENLREKYSENITSLFAKEFSGGFCYIRVKENYVHIGWFRGSKIQDEFGFLEGNGKQIRGQKVRVLAEKEKEAIAFYVKESYIVLVEKDALTSKAK